MNKKEILLTTAELAQRWKLGVGHLRNLRCRKEGPPFIRITPRVVRYRLFDIEKWEHKR